MNLPNADQAQVGRAKITEYLLSNVNPVGGGKADFFISFGFSADRWEEFAASLKQQGTSHEVGRIVESTYGVRYIVEGTLETPDNRNPSIRTVWQIDVGSAYPRLITAYPVRR